jgi:hypothetical protein
MVQSRENSPNRRILGWQLFLEKYEFEIKHRSATKHANADGPSRLNTQTSEVNYGEKVDLACSLEELEKLEPSPDDTITVDLSFEHQIDISCIEEDSTNILMIPLSIWSN